MRRILLALPLAALVPATASADCGWVNGLVPSVLTPDKAPLVGGGGILVALVPTPMTSRRQAAPPPPVWKLRSGALEDTTIAPGLVVRVPSGTTKGNEYELVDLQQKHLVSVFSSQDLSAPVPVPDVSEVVTTGATSYRTSGQIKLKTAVPEGVAAIVLASATGTPREFMLVKKGDVLVDPIHGHCQEDPAGTEVTQTGDSVTLFYVDDHGRVSKPTKKFKVKAPPPPPRATP